MPSVIPTPTVIANTDVVATIELTPPAIQAVVEPVLEYEILERNGTSLQVRFVNPFHVGDFVEEEYTDIVDGEEVLLVRQVDKDPNHDVVKSINVPLTLEGKADRAVLKQIIIDQARGVKHRMERAAAQLVQPVERDLDTLIGEIL